MVSFQPNMQAQDDLAALFSRNLNFSPELQGQYDDYVHAQAQVQAQDRLSPPKPLNEDDSERTQTRAPREPVLAIPRSDSSPAPITYSISQHYTHSAHLARQPSQVQAHPEQQQQQQQLQQQLQEHHRRSSEPTPSEQLTSEMILSQQGINPALLSPSQVQLFRISENPHKERLIELWRVAPPIHSQDNPSLAWTSTTLEQEELLARLRYERLLEEEKQQQQRRDAEMTMDCGVAHVQSSDGRWLSTTATQGVEPYMMSGYEELMRGEGGRPYSHATDPVYKGQGDAWLQQQLQQRQLEERQMRMENQHGTYQQHQFGGPGAHTEAMEIV